MSDGRTALGRFSLGVGDRFALEAAAQLRAFVRAAERGTVVVPVWNKSNREHLAVGSRPESVRLAADAAVSALRWKHGYFVDADHVTLDTVDPFVGPSDFFTLDVSALIGTAASADAIAAFATRHPELSRPMVVPGIAEPLELTKDALHDVAGQYLAATVEAGRIYRHLAQAKGAGSFVTEVSMDEAARPQSPAELLVVLAALADAGVPLQTIAPRFSGRFNKGVDYEGDVARFEWEFAADACVLRHAAAAWELPRDLKLSVHSGSDKFAIFPAIRRTLRAHGAGVHLKTSGTTWLEEVVGLAESGGDGLALAREIYRTSYERRAELCAPYTAVIAIDPARLPLPDEVDAWSGKRFVAALRHDPGNPAYSPDLRQLVHVGYKVAADMGPRFTGTLAACREACARNVSENLFERHLRPLFLDD